MSDPGGAPCDPSCCHHSPATALSLLCHWRLCLRELKESNTGKNYRMFLMPFLLRNIRNPVVGLVSGQSQELESMILMGPSWITIFRDSILSFLLEFRAISASYVFNPKEAVLFTG